MRADKLPDAATTSELYLAALLDEIRDLKSLIAPVYPTEQVDEIIVKEPVKSYRGNRK